MKHLRHYEREPGKGDFRVRWGLAGHEFLFNNHKSPYRTFGWLTPNKRLIQLDEAA